MKRSKRLQPILDIAKLKSRKGVQAVAYMRQKLEHEQGKLSQLMSCKEEYQTPKNSFKKQSFNSQTLKSLRQFKANVELAIQQQIRQVETVGAQFEQVKVHWRTLDARSQSLEKTQMRLINLENRQLDKLEQRELEEMVTQASQGRRGYSAI